MKKEYNVSILQLERWKQVIDNCMVLASEKGLNNEFIRNVLIQVQDEAIRLQSRIWNESNSGVPKK
ncbi:MAG: chorismate mutase [Bacteroidetes bacterium]|nr:chorismate mutase [Bacteroidota bacterium]